jgi:hypothetical protein
MCLCLHTCRLCNLRRDDSSLVNQDSVISGSNVSIVEGESNQGERTRAQYENCLMSGSFLGSASLSIAGEISVTLRRCTVQVS